MENKIDISVIIPMYNSEKYIAKTISSILFQKPHGLTFEIIVVDDVSNDNSCAVVKNINNEHIRLIELEKNGGTANARNTGITLAKGKWIQFVDSDDTICNDLYSKFELAIQPEINCYIFSLIIEEHDHTLKRRIVEVKDKRAIGYFYAVWNLFTSRAICLKFNSISRQNEDVCFIIDMMNRADLNVSLIEDAFYLLNRKNDASKMANFNIKEYQKMYAYVNNQIDKSDSITKMFILESFVGIVFSKNMPFVMSLQIAIKTILKLYKYLPAVYSNGIRNCVKNTLIS